MMVELATALAERIKTAGRQAAAYQEVEVAASLADADARVAAATDTLHAAQQRLNLQQLTHLQQLLELDG